MFFIQIPFFDLNKTYESGQNLMWKKICDDKYIVMHRDKIVQIEQTKDRFRLSCNQEDFYNVWYDYFDVGTDYLDLFYKCSFMDKELIKPVCVRGSGIRIIKQDIFQVIISSILTRGLYDKKQQWTHIYKFLECFGKNRKNSLLSNDLKWKEFPSYNNVLKHVNRYTSKTSNEEQNIEDIICICELINEGWFTLDDFECSSPNEVYSVLREYLSSDVCKKICVFGKHDFTKFIYDGVVKEYLQENFSLTGKEFYDIFAGKENKDKLAYLSVLFRYDYFKGS